MIGASADELEAAAALTNLFLIYEYKSRRVTPSLEMIASFRANLGPGWVHLTDDEIEQAITELIHFDGVTGSTELHEMRFIDDDMTTFWRLLKGAMPWKSFLWKRADVPYIAPWLAALRATA